MCRWRHKDRRYFNVPLQRFYRWFISDITFPRRFTVTEFKNMPAGFCHRSISESSNLEPRNTDFFNPEEPQINLQIQYKSAFIINFICKQKINLQSKNHLEFILRIFGTEIYLTFEFDYSIEFYRCFLR